MALNYVRNLCVMGLIRREGYIDIGLNKLGQILYLVMKISLERMTWGRGKGNIIGGTFGHFYSSSVYQLS